MEHDRIVDSDHHRAADRAQHLRGDGVARRGPGRSSNDRGPAFSTVDDRDERRLCVRKRGSPRTRGDRPRRRLSNLANGCNSPHCGRWRLHCSPSSSQSQRSGRSCGHCNESSSGLEQCRKAGSTVRPCGRGAPTKSSSSPKRSTTSREPQSAGRARRRRWRRVNSTRPTSTSRCPAHSAGRCTRRSSDCDRPRTVYA